MSQHIYSLLSPNIINQSCIITSTVSYHDLMMALVHTSVHLNRTWEEGYGIRSGLVQAWLHTQYIHPPNVWIVLDNAEKPVYWMLFPFFSKVEETCFPTEDSFSWLNHETEQYRISVKLVPASAVGFSQGHSSTKFMFSTWHIEHTQCHLGKHVCICLVYIYKSGL